MSLFPVFEFILTNHTSQNQVLTDIALETTFLPVGLSGLGPEPRVLKSLVRYHISIDRSLKINHPIIFDEIDIPAKTSAKFEVELSEKEGTKVLPFDYRIVLQFAFKNWKHCRTPTDDISELY